MFSCMPNIMFMFCTACPAEPFIRLSIADTAIKVFVRSLISNPQMKLFDPVTLFSSGVLPPFSILMNCSSLYILYAHVISEDFTPGISLAYIVSSIPRLTGRRCGVKFKVILCPAGFESSCSISEVCRWPVSLYALNDSSTSQKCSAWLGFLPAPVTPDFASIIMESASISLFLSNGYRVSIAHVV